MAKYGSREEFKLRKLSRQVSGGGGGGVGPQGPPGVDGQDGADGADGAPGVGVPAGGTAGQVLTKIDGVDYNTNWTTPSGGGGGVSDGDKGDITVSSSGTVWMVDDGVITLLKQANVNSGTVFYRKSASAGPPEVQTLATLKTDLGLTGTNSGDQTITLTGNVTGSGTGSFAATIANDAVDNPKLANMAANTIKGRITASTGDPEDLTAANVRTIINVADGATANATDAQLRDRATHTGTQSADTIVDGSTNHVFTAADDTKLAGIATGATANSTDATLLARANHTGTQTASTISDFNEAVDDRVGTLLVEGSGIDLTYDDGAGTLTVAATGGGGGSSPTTVVHLAADDSASGTVGGEVTGLSTTLTAGTYVFQYYLIYQSAATTTGVKWGINYTGTTTRFAVHRRFVSTGTTTVSQDVDQDTAAAAATIMGVFAERALSTTAPNIGQTASVDTANADVLEVLDGVIVVSDGGDLELWHASEVSATSTVMAGSSLILTKIA